MSVCVCLYMYVHMGVCEYVSVCIVCVCVSVWINGNVWECVWACVRARGEREHMLCKVDKCKRHAIIGLKSNSFSMKEWVLITNHSKQNEHCMWAWTGYKQVHKWRHPTARIKKQSFQFTAFQGAQVPLPGHPLSAIGTKTASSRSRESLWCHCTKSLISLLL